MAPRATWNGYLKLSLVSCSVSLFPATTSAEKTRFHVINRKTGNRVKRVFIDAETEKVVESENQVKGFEAQKGEYLLIENEEIDDIRIESTHTIDIERFVPREEVNSRFLDSPYFCAPDDKVAQEAFAVIREAMEKEGKVGIGRIVMARREHMVLLEPLDRGILATTLRYPYEMREEGDYFGDIPKTRVSGEMLELASHIIDKKSGPFKPDAFEDRYEKALVGLVKSKQNGKPPPTQKDAPKPSNVINLMDALKKSIAAGKVGGRSSARPAAKQATAKRSPARSGAKRRASG